MKVKIIEEDKIVTSKRFKDLTPEQIKASVSHPEFWDDNCVFVEPVEEDDSWVYMLDYEIEIIEE